MCCVWQGTNTERMSKPGVRSYEIQTLKLSEVEADLSTVQELPLIAKLAASRALQAFVLKFGATFPWRRPKAGYQTVRTSFQDSCKEQPKAAESSQKTHQPYSLYMNVVFMGRCSQWPNWSRGWPVKSLRTTALSNCCAKTRSNECLLKASSYVGTWTKQSSLSAKR